MSKEEWEKFKEEQFQATTPMAADMAFIAVSIADIVKRVVESAQQRKQLPKERT